MRFWWRKEFSKQPLKVGVAFAVQSLISPSVQYVRKCFILRTKLLAFCSDCERYQRIPIRKKNCCKADGRCSFKRTYEMFSSRKNALEFSREQAFVREQTFVRKILRYSRWEPFLSEAGFHVGMKISTRANDLMVKLTL